MEDAESLNFTDGSSPLASLQSLPKSPFPAWVPAVTVAIAMIAFLAVSFYLRHRKVVKKRQILMDYFYVIFQYGAMRRKRMVTTLCNTNAITLRDLGRSFMMSCDSGGNDNSCPFYPDEAPFSRPQASQRRRPLVRKHSFFKSRGMTITKKYRGPFIRLRADSEERTRRYTSSFQDIMMKFRAKRQQNEIAASAPRQNLLAPQFEGCSMSTIHGDEVEYESFVEENETPVNYNRQRRNAYTLQCDKTLPTFADVVAEAGRHSMGRLSDRLTAQNSPYPGKRNSEPWQNLPGQRGAQSQRQGQQPDVFHVHGGILTPSNVVCGSHGYIANVGEHCGTFQSFRNSEPTILVHAASTEAEESSQGWNDIRSKCTNGAVILQRVPKADGAPGEFYYKEKKTPPLDRVARANLSKVSYVPSGNMNEYYNCISPSKETHPKVEEPVNKIIKGKKVVPPSFRGKRGRFSLGNLAVSNFNRRIDMASDSLPEYDPEQSTENRRSSDSNNQQRPSSRTTWTRLKRVFSGSRAAESLHEQVKATKSLSVSDAHKIICQQEGTRWQRFLNVFTGFRSLPETNEDDDVVAIPKASSSYPTGLNLLTNNESNFGLKDFASSNEASPSESTQQRVPGTPFFRTASFNEKENDVNNKRNTGYRQYYRRPSTLPLQPRTLSFPEESKCPNFQTISETAKAFNKKTSNSSSAGSQSFRKPSNQFAPSSIPLPNSKKKCSRSYSFEAGYEISRGVYRFNPQFEDCDSASSTPARLEGNKDIDESESAITPCRVRSLSPLHETSLDDSTKDGTYTLTSKLESVPEFNVYMTPLENGYSPEEDSNFDIKYSERLLNSVDWLLQQSALFPNSSPPPGQSILHVTDFTPDESYDKQNHLMTTENLEGINTLYASANQNVMGSDNIESPLEPTKQACSTDKLYQACLLTPEHRNVSCSTESVYYDTVSALCTPSPCEATDLPDFTGLNSHSKLQEIPCVHLNNRKGSLDIKMAPIPCDTNFNSEVHAQAASITHTSTESLSFPNIPSTASIYEIPPSLLIEHDDIKSSSPTLTTSQITLDVHYAAENLVENLSLALVESKECDSTNCSQISLNETLCAQTSTNITNCVCTSIVANCGTSSTHAANCIQHCTNLANCVQTCTNLDNCVQTSTNVANYLQTSTNVANCGQTYSIVANCCTASTNVTNNDQASTNIANCSQTSSDSANYDQISTNDLNYSTPSTNIAHCSQTSSDSANYDQISTNDTNYSTPSTNIAHCSQTSSESGNNVETSTNVINSISPPTASTPWGSHLQTLPVPELKVHSNEHESASQDGSPQSSRPSTPTRRHSTPCPSPEMSPSRQSGQCSPDEMYMANVARLPRLSKRTSCFAAVPNCASHNVFRNYDNTNGNSKESISIQTRLDTAPV